MSDYENLNQKQLLVRFLKAASAYGIGGILIRAGNFILLPLYWQILTPEDYGVIGLSQTLIIFLGPLLSLGLYEAVVRQYYEWEKPKRKEHLGSLWLFSILLSTSIVVVLDFTGEFIFPIIFKSIEFNPYLRIALWTAYFSSFALIPQALFRVREQLKVFSMLSVGVFLTQSCLTILFLFYFKWGVKGYLLGGLISHGAWALLFAGYVVTKSKINLKWEYLKSPLKYSLPLIPASMFESGLSVLDRFFLEKFLPLSTLGLYTLAAQFGQALNIFHQMLKSSWTVFSVKVTKQHEEGRYILGLFAVFYIGIMTIPSLGLSLFIEEIIHVIGKPEYYEVGVYVPFFVFIYLVSVLGTSLGRGIDLSQKTQFAPLIPLAGLLTALISMPLLIPKFGVWGAIGSLVLVTFFKNFTQIIIANFLFPRKIFYRQILLFMFTPAIIFCVFNQAKLTLSVWEIPLKILALLLYSFALLKWIKKRTKMESNGN